MWGAITLYIAMLVLAAFAYAYPLCHGSSVVSRDGLTPATRAVLSRTEDHFHVRFKIVGACVHKMMSTDPGRMSYHSWGMAVDMLVPRGTSKADVISYLYHQERVLVMTYVGSAHIHFNLGQGAMRIHG